MTNAVITSRGFERFNFSDMDGEACSMQKSSDGGNDAILLGLDAASPMVLAGQAAQYGIKTKESTGWIPLPAPDGVFINTRMRLSREQVAALLPVLQQFVDTGEIGPLPDENL